MSNPSAFRLHGLRDLACVSGLGLALIACPAPSDEESTTASPVAASPAAGTPAATECTNDKAAWPDAPRCQAISAGSQCCDIAADDLSYEMPIDVCRFALNGWTWQQGDLDHFSWLSFVALNWPTEPPPSRGAPNQGMRPGAAGSDGADAPVVWQSWKTVEDVFPADGTTPSKKWNEWSDPPAGCPDIPDAPIFRMTSKARPKTTDAIGGEFNEAVGGPLVDQAGNLVLFQIHMNETEFEWISQKGYNTGTKIPADFKWPADVIDSDTGLGSDGAVEVKAAWKELSDAEWSSGRFYQQNALFYYPGDSNSAARCDEVRVGLVGLHIAHKVENLASFTEDSSAWVWSTFEHVDNVPPAGANGASGAKYSFYDPSCSPAVDWATCAALDTSEAHPEEAYRCCPNLWRWKPIGPEGGPLDMPRTADQVTRIDALGDGSGCSPVFATALAGTLWENYTLVGTQWIGPHYEGGQSELQPAVLRNTTLETYVTKNETKDGSTVQVNVSSCDGCHSSGTDHSFVFPQ